jgi:SAM-dependent methyltransferase
MPPDPIPPPGLPPEGLAALRARVAARYAGASRFAQGFVAGKLKRDPATEAVLALAAASPFGAVADLGCGRGQLSLALLVAGLAERVEGLDRDAGKIADAARAAAGLPARYAAADLTAAVVPDCDTVLLIDVLLQMPETAQRALLARVAAAARRRVLVRAFDPDCGWRAGLGVAMERLGRAVRRDGAEIAPMPLPALRGIFDNAGFRTAVRPCWDGTPLPNVLLVAERAA